MKITKWCKGVKEEKNEGESGKKKEEFLEICETREKTRFNWSKTVGIKITKWWKGAEEEVNERESGKEEEEEGLEIYQTRENATH